MEDYCFVVREAGGAPYDYNIEEPISFADGLARMGEFMNDDSPTTYFNVLLRASKGVLRSIEVDGEWQGTGKGWLKKGIIEVGVRIPRGAGTEKVEEARTQWPEGPYYLNAELWEGDAIVNREVSFEEGMRTVMGWMWPRSPYKAKLESLNLFGRLEAGRILEVRVADGWLRTDQGDGAKDAVLSSEPLENPFLRRACSEGTPNESARA